MPWKFGVDQKKKQECDEIRAAQVAGRSEAYVAGQEYRRMIEAETARRRSRKGSRRLEQLRACGYAAATHPTKCPGDVDAPRGMAHGE